MRARENTMLQDVEMSVQGRITMEYRADKLIPISRIIGKTYPQANSMIFLWCVSLLVFSPKVRLILQGRK